MERIAIYIHGVCAAGIFCAILIRLLPEKSSFGNMTKIICGITMVFAVVAPVCELSPIDLTREFTGIQAQQQDYIQLGEELSREAVSDIIKTRTEAYILDKAAYWAAELSVEIVLSEDTIPVPVSVTIRGNIPPYGKSALSTILTQELGIAKEQQTWICTS